MTSPRPIPDARPVAGPRRAPGPTRQTEETPQAPRSPEVIDLCRVPIHSITSTGVLDYIDACLGAGVGGWVLTPNLDILRRLRRDNEFRVLCGQTTLRLADGMPLVWASRFQGTPLPERVAGSDLIWSLCQRAAERSWRVVLVGGTPPKPGQPARSAPGGNTPDESAQPDLGAAAAAARLLRDRYPGLNIPTTFCPPFGFESDNQYIKQLSRDIASHEPRVVFVGLGSPKQERLIHRLREDMPNIWFLGVGVSFSFVAGDVRRAPPWMRRAGLEWLHRLGQEPRRLARRYIVHGLPFALYLLAASALSAPAARRAANRQHATG